MGAMCHIAKECAVIEQLSYFWPETLTFGVLQSLKARSPRTCLTQSMLVIAVAPAAGHLNCPRCGLYPIPVPEPDSSHLTAQAVFARRTAPSVQAGAAALMAPTSPPVSLSAAQCPFLVHCRRDVGALPSCVHVRTAVARSCVLSLQPTTQLWPIPSSRPVKHGGKEDLR